MRKGLQRRAAAISLWALAGIYGFSAYAVFKHQSALLIILAGLTWLALYIFFIRIPHTD